MAAFIQAYPEGRWLLLFYVCSFAGWCWEVGLYLTMQRRFVNRGFLTGPFLPIYGVGAALILIACLPLTGHPVLVALAGAFWASALEYAAGEAMEALFHVRYWDYSAYRWNFRGHVCLLSALTWAVMAVILMRAIHPWLSQVLLRLPSVFVWSISLTLSVFSTADGAASVGRAMDIRRLLEEQKGIAGGERSDGRVLMAQRFLRRNPSASSKRHEQPFAVLSGHLNEKRDR